MNRPPSTLLRLLLASLVLVAATHLACGGDPNPPEASDAAVSTDAATALDAQTPADAAAQAGEDAAVADLPDAGAAGEDAAVAEPHDAAVPEPPDAAVAEPPDAGIVVPLAGFGTISGTCGVLDVELTDDQPYYFENHLDFGTDPYNLSDLSRLTPGAQTVLTDPNAGGSSIYSETFAFEVLARCELASVLKTENEIVYSDIDAGSNAITDILVEIDGLKVGVSVTRAYVGPFSNPPAPDVSILKGTLEKKLKGILASSARVAPEDKWVKQILSVIALDQDYADAWRTAYEQVAADLRADTILYVTVSDGADDCIYTNHADP